MLVVSCQPGTAAPVAHCGNVGTAVRSPFWITTFRVVVGASFVPAQSSGESTRVWSLPTTSPMELTSGGLVSG